MALFPVMTQGVFYTLTRTRSERLMVPGLVGTSIALAAFHLPFQSLCILSLVGFLYPHLLIQLGLSFDKWCRRRRLNTAAVVALLAGLSVISVILLGTEPAAAQFFNKTQQWVENTLSKDASGSGSGSGGNNVKTMVALTFNVLRFIFVIYLGIALVKVIQAAREGEDWQTLARTPAIILLTVTLGDMLGSMITGSGSSSTG